MVTELLITLNSIIKITECSFMPKIFQHRVQLLGGGVRVIYSYHFLCTNTKHGKLSPFLINKPHGKARNAIITIRI